MTALDKINSLKSRIAERKRNRLGVKDLEYRLVQLMAKQLRAEIRQDRKARS